MSKQRKTIKQFPGVDPSLDHASSLVQEYTSKLRTVIRRIRNVRENYLAAAQERLKKSPSNKDNPVNQSPQEQQVWHQVVDGFRTRNDEYSQYVRSLIPQARRLAQHVSQLITHGTNDTIIKIELSLRVAELESAIQTAQTLSASNVAFVALQ